MNRRYNPQRIADNSGIPWRTTPEGLRVVDMPDVPSKAKEPEEERDAKGYPNLDAYKRPAGCGLSIRCRFCLRWHYHGHGAGHRLAHCHREDSPYHRSGYKLKPIGKPIPKYKNGKSRPPEPRA